MQTVDAQEIQIGKFGVQTKMCMVHGVQLQKQIVTNVKELIVEQFYDLIKLNFTLLL